MSTLSIYRNYDGHIIIPMTIVNPDYYQEIIGKLRENGMVIRHYILTASKEIITERLLHRGEEKGSWAHLQIERCLKAFEKDICGYKVDTNRRSVKETAEFIYRDFFSEFAS